MKKKVVILGAGIVGRLAKLMIPEATVLESKGPKDAYTSELGVCISITKIPHLTNQEYRRYITIDGQKPNLELINKYKKKIAREGDISYGDCRQFEPSQTVYRQTLPQNLDIQFHQSVVKVYLDDQKIRTAQGRTLRYDYLLSTIPLINLVQVSDLFNLFKDQSSTFFMHRPIYLSRVPCSTGTYEIHENYRTSPDDPIYRENKIDGWSNQESLFKLPDSFKIYPGKIYPCSYTSQMLEDLRSYKVFCAGRYAEWDNKIHLWNVYAQLRMIREMIE